MRQCNICMKEIKHLLDCQNRTENNRGKFACMHACMYSPRILRYNYTTCLLVERQPLMKVVFSSSTENLMHEIELFNSTILFHNEMNFDFYPREQCRKTSMWLNKSVLKIMIFCVDGQPWKSSGTSPNFSSYNTRINSENLFVVFRDAYLAFKDQTTSNITF